MTGCCDKAPTYAQLANDTRKPVRSPFFPNYNKCSAHRVELHEPQPVLFAGQQVFKGAVGETLWRRLEIQSHYAPGADVELLPGLQRGGVCRVATKLQWSECNTTGTTLHDRSTC